MAANRDLWRGCVGMALALSACVRSVGADGGETMRWQSPVPADLPTSGSFPVAVPFDASRWQGGDGGQLPALSVTCDGTVQPSQFEPDLDKSGRPLNHGRLWWRYSPAPGGGDRTASVSVRAAPNPPGAVKLQLKRDDDGITVHEGDRLVLKFLTASTPVCPGDPRKVCALIHPLKGLDGETLTAFGPKDHPHHRGVYWVWPRVLLDGKELPGQWEGRDALAVFDRLLYHEAGPAAAIFTVQSYWRAKAGKPGPGRRIVRERATVRVFESDEWGRAVDVDLELLAVVDNVSIGGRLPVKGYGGFSYRSPKEAALVYVDGKEQNGKSNNQIRARWVDHVCRFDDAPGGALSGVAIFPAADHPDYPPPWTTRYYGYLGLGYPGLKLLELSRTEPLRLRYRLWIHRGGPVEGHVEQAHRAYVATWKWRPINGVSK